MKIILDLCGGTGSWSRPYKDAGYDVRVITLPEYDVLDAGVQEMCVNLNPHGILAAPPCTMFSHARMRAKTPRDIGEGMLCVRACLDIIWRCMEVTQPTQYKKLPLQFWALENPYYGFLIKLLGKPAFTFDPWEFGDGYKKRTAIWGYFKEPVKGRIPISDYAMRKCRAGSFSKFDILQTKDIHPEYYETLTRAERRSITPAGFARAFFEANP